MEFSNKLTQLRKQKGFSQETLAEKIGVSRQAISKWENEESYPDLPKLIALSQVLEVTLDELCGQENKVTTEITTESKPKKNFKRIIMLCLLVVSFLLGNISSNLKTEPIPDNLEITNANFYVVTGTFYVECTNNIISDQLNYEMIFTSFDGETTQIPLTCELGVCKAEEKYQLKANYPYTVNLVVSNGKEKRLLPIATNFRYQKDFGFSWTNKY